ncbi:alpha/beta hydrolase-fold protein [Emticicia sp. 21SJ11W-3]|uniref:carboxylesterase family protein n=1 Tax=Emticicia sp. 21SJ11W-3 TaxID=2916755 RepID=UPI00209E53DC|nr:alpha/beta hydrolase-fold protein [Emticicia sp. 21SJ11W-3]UTA68142.1 dienelactone hydrolase family protein [Emticicia sp. 21SJ11W-3]
MKTLILRTILTAFVLSGFHLLTFGQKLAPGPQVLTFHSDVDDTEQPYGLYLPKNYNPKKKYPLVVMLHGAGSNHRLALRRVFGKSNAEGESDVEASRYFPEWKDVNYIVISAYARGTMGYQGVAEKDVMDMLADAKKRFSIDENRTYLTGLSMGGGGTMWIGLSYPDIWAAIAPVCPAPPAGTLEMVPNALNYPVYFFQGDQDPAVKVDSTRKWVQRFKDAGAQVEYTEYPGVKHNSWENAYKDEFIFSWFSQFKRNPFPERVRFATSQYKHNKAYWVVFDEFTPGTTASIDAQFTAKNKLEITTKGLLSFTLKLDGHPSFKSKLPLELVINGQAIKAETGSGVTLTQNNNTWAVNTSGAFASAKKPGAEGPMAEALADRHIYVYGTGGSPSADELNRRRTEAQKAMEWSVYRGDFIGRVMVFPRLLSDKEVRPSDIESSNLILFGTKETNSLIDKFSDKLPVQLKASATDYGLAYVFPVGARYVLVNSGLPWWTLTENQNAMSRQNSPMPMNNIARFQDFVLFKGTVNNVIAGGRFNNDWTLPAKEAEKLKASGVVVFR